ncbi:unnamed protein product [Callosobruchus maculatus]|uniref:Uncharacterized protein n=1 Tax=Callosobruchus maculatus TaxID=64391 RepID=A0A653CHD1_CALMS|nr:unnamed protein product [Callosobruchus maculatus]
MVKYSEASNDYTTVEIPGRLLICIIISASIFFSSFFQPIKIDLIMGMLADKPFLPVLLSMSAFTFFT